ncbi:hypothetical protein [Christiangramia sp.]|uniref:helix-turn-helix domain-containing protein n=1 Tax=Christiangramia sp. TaxID=1931228 RepID=UPI00260186D1|nr:hypothetical protein [Christiangramia sp.]
MAKKQYINKNLVKAVCDLLKEIREEDGRIQDDVSTDIFNDIKYNFHIGRLETSGGNMRISTLFELCKSYGIPVSEFFKKLEEKYPSLRINSK